MGEMHIYMTEFSPQSQPRLFCSGTTKEKNHMLMSVCPLYFLKKQDFLE